MKRLFIFPALALALVVILAACGSEATTSSTGTAALPASLELKEAGQELFDTFSTSMQAGDGAALHAIFVADLRQRCTVEQLQESLTSGGDPFPNAEVSSIYLDLEDHSNALMQLTLLEQEDGSPTGLAEGFALAFPFPMEFEEDGWKLGFPSLGLVPDDGCPFAGGSSQDEAAVSAQRRAQAEPRVLPSTSLINLEPPSGALTVMSSSGGGEGQFTSSTLLDTNLSLETLLEHYRGQVIQPGWDLGQDTREEDLAAFTWISRDDVGGSPVFGALLITSSEEGMWWVRMWTGGSSDITGRMIVEERLIPVEPIPAPTR